MARTVVYCSEDDFLPLIPEQDKLDALDDDGDGEPDEGAITAIIDSACDEIDSFYSIRGVAVPLDISVEVGAKVYAKYLCVAHMYARRKLTADRSGHAAMIKTCRDLLTKIAEGRMDIPSLKASTGGTTGSGGVPVPGDGTTVDVVSEEALTIPGRNRILS